MPYIGNQTSTAFTSMAKQDITGDGGASYTLTHAVANEQEIEVFVNNVRQEPGVAYTVNGTALTMTGNVASTDDFYVVFQGKAIATANHPSTQPLSATTGTFSGDVVVASGDPKIRLEDSDAPSGTYNLINGNGASGRLVLSADAGNTASSSSIQFRVDGSETVRFNADGGVLVGKTANNSTSVGANIRSDKSFFTSDGKEALVLNRLTSDGKIIELRKANGTVGIIGAVSGDIFIAGPDSNHAAIRLAAGNKAFLPVTSLGALSDNTTDLGQSNARYDDVVATNGTIQTSDQNEKQQIASLTTAEITAAKAISKLFKTFKWQDKVAAKGDAARTHTGVIAQEVQAAMTDAGLNAAHYAFWCSDTWTNDDGTSQTRLGIRYPELLAFVGAATEQRLANIETRLTALEAE